MSIPGGQILVRFARSAASFGDVMLEQEPWGKYVGYLTRAGVVAYLDSLLFGDPEEDLTESCGTDAEGTVTGVVYAYPDPADLNYIAGISHGKLGPRRVSTLIYAEVLQIQLDTEPSLKYPTANIISADWLTDAYDQDGATLPLPAVDTSGGRVLIADAVYGSLLVRYEVVRHTYSVQIAPRPGSTENSWQSYVYAVWAGGTKAMEYRLPDEATAIGGGCNNRGWADSIKSPDYMPPTVLPEDIDKFWDYCTNAAVEEE